MVRSIRQQLRAKADPKHGKNDFGAAFMGAVEQISSIVSAEFAKDPTGDSMKKPSSAPSGAVLAILFVIAFVGALNKYAGAFVGGVSGAGVAYFYTLGGFSLLALPILAAAIGYFGTFILSTSGKIGGALGSSGGSGGGFSGSGSSSDSSSSFDSGFSGGGGSSGGGGASG